MTEDLPARTSLRLSEADIEKIGAIVGKLAQSSLPLPDLLRCIAADLPEKSLRNALNQLSHDISQGKSVEESLENIQDRSNNSAIGLLRAVIQTRASGETLFQILRYQQARKDLQRTFWLRLIYPIALLLCASLLFGGILRVVAYEFLPIFRDFGIALPGLTQMIVSLSETASEIGLLGYFVPFAFCSVLILIVFWGINSNLQKWQELAQFCRISADLMDSECSLPETMAITSLMTKGKLARAIENMIELVEQGVSFPDAIDLQSAIPLGLSDLYHWSASHGGNGSEGLRVAASLYEARGRSQVKFLNALLTVVTAIFVIWMILISVTAIFTPMISLLRMLSG